RDWSSDVCSSDLLARGAADPLADVLGDAGGGERAGDHEHRGNDDRRLAGEPGQGLVAVEHAGHRERQQDQHRADVDAHAFADEQVQAAGEDQQEKDLVQVHGGIVPAGGFTLSTLRRDARLIPSSQHAGFGPMLTAQTPSDTATGDLVRLAMASLGHGVAILDRDGRWLEANPALEHMLGRTAAQLAGEAVQASVVRGTQALDAGIGAVLAGNAQALHLAVAFAHADGRAVPATVDLAPMRAGDGPIAWLSMLVVEEAGAALAQQLAATEAALRSLERLQASFAHGVSHDLRAPLRAIDSFSALLAEHLDDGLDDTARDYLARIRGAGARMAALIDSLLE